MGIYILRRLALIVPTLVGIMLLNFVIVQAAPGGPVEQLIAQMEGHGDSALARASGGGGSEVTTGSGGSRASRGIPDELLQEIRVYQQTIHHIKIHRACLHQHHQGNHRQRHLLNYQQQELLFLKYHLTMHR